MVIGPSVVGNGTLELAPVGFSYGNATAEFKGLVGAGETFAFAPQTSLSTSFPATDELTVDQAREFLGKIANFAQSDTIDLPGVTATGSQFRNGTLTLYNGHAPVAALHFAGSYAASDFAVSPSNGATIITHT